MAFAPLATLSHWYNKTMSQADPRVRHMPLMEGPEKTLAAVALYLLFVSQGPRLMANFKPLRPTALIIIYNLAMVVLSTYIFGTFLWGLFVDGHNFVCTTVSESLNRGFGGTGLIAGWWFMFSKILEFADTIFFILAKKFNHVTFLHVYHHSSMTLMSWVGLKFVPGGQSAIYPLVNSFVHIIMYTYYTLAAMGPTFRKYLWWKRYLTIIQITQFVILLVQTLVNALSDCEFPKIFSYAALIYGTTILLLFLNFYYKTYSRKDKREASKDKHE